MLRPTLTKRLCQKQSTLYTLTLAGRRFSNRHSQKKVKTNQSLGSNIELHGELEHYASVRFDRTHLQLLQSRQSLELNFQLNPIFLASLYQNEVVASVSRELSQVSTPQMALYLSIISATFCTNIPPFSPLFRAIELLDTCHEFALQ